VVIPDEYRDREDVLVVVSFHFRDKDEIARIRKNRIDRRDLPGS